MARTCEQSACRGFRGDEVGGGRRNVWPFLGCESQTMVCRHQEWQPWVTSSTGPGSSLGHTACVGFASSQVWLSKLPPSVHLPRPPATTSSSLGQLRVRPSLASFHVVVGRLCLETQMGVLFKEYDCLHVVKCFHLSNWKPRKTTGFLFFQIPPGIQTDQKIRLSGKGIPRINSYGYGDHYIHVKIRVPK